METCPAVGYVAGCIRTYEGAPYGTPGADPLSMLIGVLLVGVVVWSVLLLRWLR